jgi:hypothetical protein
MTSNGDPYEIPVGAFKGIIGTPMTPSKASYEIIERIHVFNWQASTWN